MINIVLGDITNLKDVDVIVSSAKKTLLGGGGVDGAIHNKAGRGLIDECMRLGGCDVGEAKITKGYDLGIPYIIHAVGPIHYDKKWAKEHNYNQDELLRNAYLNSLKLAEQYNLKRIAFSAISTGAYSYPIDEACIIALSTIQSFLDEHKDDNYEITFVLYLEEFFHECIKQANILNIPYSTGKIEDESEDCTVFEFFKNHKEDYENFKEYNPNRINTYNIDNQDNSKVSILEKIKNVFKK